MVSVDTNVLVRILIDDPAQQQQNEWARSLVHNCAQKIYITQIVQVECVWVLRAVYRLDKSAIIGILNHLVSNEMFVLQRLDLFKTAFYLYQRSQAGFSDCLILAESQAAKTELFTFDKKLLKLAGTKRVS